MRFSRSRFGGAQWGNALQQHLVFLCTSAAQLEAAGIPGPVRCSFPCTDPGAPAVSLTGILTKRQRENAMPRWGLKRARFDDCPNRTAGAGNGALGSHHHQGAGTQLHPERSSSS